jgi:dipeptidyl aminopeptidase/acylaminoacyl peptidase
VRSDVPEDLIDGKAWLVGKGVADPKKVAIVGGSYGGYATLVGLTFTPDEFACGVGIVGPSNIVALLKTITAYWAPAKALFAKRVGDLEEEEEFLKDRSPLFKVNDITKPLLIGQGKNDPRVKVAESDQIVEAMRRNGKAAVVPAPIARRDDSTTSSRPRGRPRGRSSSRARATARGTGSRSGASRSNRPWSSSTPT